MCYLSIIIPVYNVESYIFECLSSVAAQWQPGIEVVIVNDGSLDASAEIIKSQFAVELSEGKFILIEQENKGVSAARNLGIDKSSGDYIGFIDADDIILPGYIDSILECILLHAPDIIEFGWQRFINLSDINTAVPHFVHEGFGAQLTVSTRDSIFLASTWYPWSRAFKKRIPRQLPFPTGVPFCEDLMTLPLWYEKTNTIFHINKSLYGYRVNFSGATLNVKPSYIVSLEGFYREIIEDNSLHRRYLKIAILYAMYRCYEELDLPFEVSPELRKDVNNIRWNMWRYRAVGHRKVFIVLFPVAYFKFKKILGRL